MCSETGQQWSGLELPEGLTPERAEAAAAMIYEYEAADLNGNPHSEVMSTAELVLKLFDVLCGNPDAKSK